MSEKQTRCPKCLTTYKVSLTQLTVAQGMVCCPKCTLNFNALANLVIQDEPITPIEHATLQYSGVPASSFQYTDHSMLDIFNRRIENSNIDLLTYLNNLNYFQNDEISALPQLNLADNHGFSLDGSQNPRKKHNFQYYAIWSLVNSCLFCILIFQILWFNPRIMHNSPVLGSTFNHLCSVFSCKKLEEKYSLLTINKVKVTTIEHNKTRFTGILVNYHDKSLQLPLLKLTLKDKQQSNSIILKPQDYLAESLTGIQRIPKNLPYKFNFTLNQPRKSFDDYTLEIVHP